MIANASPVRAAVRAALYPGAWRFIGAALFVLSRASLPIILALLLFSTEPSIAPPLLIRLFLFFALLPGVAAALIRLVFAVDVEARDDGLVLQRRGQRIELDRAEIGRVVPWSVPLPGPGLSLWMAPEDRLRYALQVDDLELLVRALSGGMEAARPAGAAHPAVVYAQARQVVGLARWYHVLGKFGLFSLLPTLVFFRLDQYISYGGAFGQYLLEGLWPYLSSFAFYWVMFSIHLMLYASVWRGLAEGASLLAASVTPSRAVAVRRWAERAVQVLYYAGVPALVALRFLG
jgi:hypothetical protein